MPPEIPVLVGHQEGEVSVNMVGCSQDKVLIKTHDLLGVLQRPKHRTSLDRPGVLKAEFEGDDDPEITAPSSDCPEKKGMAALACSDYCAVRQNYICL